MALTCYSLSRCILAIIFLLHVHTSVLALKNVTLEDTDESISWEGVWTRISPGFGNPEDGHNTYMSTRSRESYAEFKFTGVAVYFVSPRWPYPATTRLTLDPSSPDAVPLVLNLEDTDTKTTEEEFGRRLVLASATGLANVEHVVRVDVGEDVDGDEDSELAIFDGFIYTAVEEGEVPASSNEMASLGRFEALPESHMTLPSEEDHDDLQSTSDDHGGADAEEELEGGEEHEDGDGSSDPLLSKSQLAVLLSCILFFVAAGICGVFAWRWRVKRRGQEAVAEEAVAKESIVSDDRTDAGQPLSKKSSPQDTIASQKR